jgi:low affinity Fe/Cu permease
MDMQTILETLNKFFSSGIGFAIIWAGIVGFFMWLSSKLNPWQEGWKKYEGSIITAIKLAEKKVPDDTPNAGLAKLDAALKFVLNAYAEANKGKQPSEKLTQEIKQGIQIKHSDLDRFGGLSK